MIKIAPSILTADFLTLGHQIHQVEQAGVNYLHLDIMDGHFVPNISFGPLIVAAIKKQSKLCLDVHLMIEQPEKYVEEFIKAGANIITVHYETCNHLHRNIQQIKNLGCKAGVAINPSTSVALLKEIIADIDLALIMSVNPGFGGQKFIPNTYNKISQLVDLKNKYQPNLEIEIDGGVNEKNIYELQKSGANIVVVGSAIFNEKDIQQNIKKLKHLAHEN